jgi:hypothetical protein
MDVLANIVTVVHLAYFVFVVGGFVGIVVGARRQWGWTLNPWFRIVHLLSVFVVLAENVSGLNCPLNVLETTLRAPEAKGTDASSGMGYLLDQYGS